MLEKIILIEDKYNRGFYFAEAASRLGKKFIWVRLWDEEISAPEELSGLLYMYISTTQDREAIRILEEHGKNALVFMDWNFGDMARGGALTEYLNQRLEAENAKGAGIFVICYSSVDYHPKKTASFVSPSGHYAHPEHIPRFDEEIVNGLVEQGVAKWNEAAARFGSFSARLWPKEAVDFFRNAEVPIPHSFSLRDPENYREKIRFYLAHLLRRPPPEHWIDDNEQAEWLHGSLKTLVGCWSAAHKGCWLADQSDVSRWQGDRELDLGAVVLILAAAMAPNNAWVDSFRWIDSVALTGKQSPEQALGLVLALGGDGGPAGTQGDAGLFTGLRVLEEAPIGAAQEGAVLSVAFDSMSELTIKLGFDMTRRGAGGQLSLKERLEMGNAGPAKGNFLKALDRAIEALSQSSKGPVEWCSIVFLPGGDGTTLLKVVVQ